MGGWGDQLDVIVRAEHDQTGVAEGIRASLRFDAARRAADSTPPAPNEPPNIGTENIRAWSGGMLAAFRAEFALDVDEVELAGDDWAFERGTYTIALTPKAGGDPIRDAGKYVTIYKLQADHSWLMARDIWNSNNPLPPQR